MVEIYNILLKAIDFMIIVKPVRHKMFIGGNYEKTNLDLHWSCLFLEIERKIKHFKN